MDIAEDVESVLAFLRWEGGGGCSRRNLELYANRTHFRAVLELFERKLDARKIRKNEFELPEQKVCLLGKI